MRTVRQAWVCIMALGVAVLSAGAGTYEAPLDVRSPGDAKLTGPVMAERKGGQMVIRFTASGPVDAEVAIVDQKGKVVRHLAAGLLGKNAPAPFKRDSLSQELVWDGKDDTGATPGDPSSLNPLHVRVRLGMQAKLDRYLGWDGNTLGPIRSVAVGAKGEVHVLATSWAGLGRMEMVVLDRDGKYLRTIMPYPAGTPAERAKSLGQLTIDGQRIPVVYSGHGHTLSPLTVGMPRQTMAWNPKGHLVAASTLATAYEHGLPRHLLAFHPQGGAPEGLGFVGPELRPPTGITWGHGEGDDPCFEYLAVSPDGRWIYYVPTTFSSPHCVFRLEWGEANGAGVEADWFGQENRPGSDDTHLNDPQGLAVDAQGRLYICDRGNDRVVIVSPEAKKIGQIAVPNPEQIAVHPKTGEIYVLSRSAPPGSKPKDRGPLSMSEYRAWKAREADRKARRGPAEAPKLVKFAAWSGEAPKQMAALDTGLEVMSIDPEAVPARLWAVIKGRLTPIEDKGDALEPGKPVEGGGNGLLHPAYVAGDPERNRVLLYQYSSNFKVFALDMETGAKSVLLEGVSDFAIAPDGSIYGTGKYSANQLLRFSADGKPLAFAGADTNVVKTAGMWIGNINLGARGIAVSPAGDLYVLRANGEGGIQSRVDVFGPDGKLKKAALVDGMGIGDCGIGVDAGGNVYVGVNVRPEQKLFPAVLEGKVPGANWLCWAQWTYQYRPPPWYYSMRNEYLYHGGAVMKFGPAGGAFYGRGSMEYESAKKAAPLARVENAPAGATDYVSGYLYQKVKAVGAEWRYPGMSIIPSSERMWGDPSCVCMGSRLGVDAFGRVYVPNSMGFNVDVLDSAGNRLIRAGQYGNADDRDGLRLAWPGFVSAAGDRLFVSDSVNRRVAVAKLEYAATGEAVVP